MRKTKQKKTVQKKNNVKKAKAKKVTARIKKLRFIESVLDRYIEKAGSEKKLCKKLKIKESTLVAWKLAKYPIPVLKSLSMQKLYPGVCSLEEIYSDFV